MSNYGQNELDSDQISDKRDYTMFGRKNTKKMEKEDTQIDL